MSKEITKGKWTLEKPKELGTYFVRARGSSPYMGFSLISTYYSGGTDSFKIKYTDEWNGWWWSVPITIDTFPPTPDQE